jgi:hypothetical protein
LLVNTQVYEKTKYGYDPRSHCKKEKYQSWQYKLQKKQDEPDDNPDNSSVLKAFH